MANAPKTPAAIAQRLGARRGRGDDERQSDAFRRETCRLCAEAGRPRANGARGNPKAACVTKPEIWRLLDDGVIEFTMCRLPTAD